MKSMRLGFALLGLLAGSVPVAAAAQQVAPGFDANRFEPAERGSDWFVLDSLDLRGGSRFAAGIAAQYGYRTLRVVDPAAGLGRQSAFAGVRASIPLRHQLMLHPGASFTLGNRFRFGAALPVQLYAEGETATLQTVAYREPESTVAVGDLRLAADVRIFGRYGDAFTLAAGVRGYLPVGAQEAYLSDGVFLRLSPRVQIAGIAGAFHYAVNLGVNLRDEKRYGGSIIGSELSYGAAFGVALLRNRLLVGPEVFGSSTVSQGQVWRYRTSPIEAILGAHWRAHSIRLGGGLGAGLADAYGSPDVRLVVGVEFVPQRPPSPHADGVADLRDAYSGRAGAASTDAMKQGSECQRLPARRRPRSRWGTRCYRRMCGRRRFEKR
jgi:hypothetical protein